MRSTCANPAPIWKLKLAAKAKALPATVRGCWAFAERAGLPIVAEYSEIISGDRLSDRPEMQRLLADVAAGMYDGVLTVEVSRLTRGDLMDQGRIMNTFKYSGTKIITPEHTYDLSEDWDEDVLQSDLMMARREYKYIKKRMQRGRQASSLRGALAGPRSLRLSKNQGSPRARATPLSLIQSRHPSFR